MRQLIVDAEFRRVDERAECGDTVACAIGFRFSAHTTFFRTLV